MMTDSKAAPAELLACVTDLHLGIDTAEQWLTRMAKLAGAAGAYCVSWVAQDLSTAKFDTSDDIQVISSQWLKDIAQILAIPNNANVALLNDLLAAHHEHEDGDLAAKLLNKPHLMVGVLQLPPVNTLLILRCDDQKLGWLEEDLNSFRNILPALLKAHEAHKLQATQSTHLDIANQILDASPRGVIAVSTEARLIRSNKMAHDIIENSSSLIVDDDGKLNFSDPVINSGFHAQLKQINTTPIDSLNKVIWNKGFHNQQDKCTIQITLRAGRVENWNMETGEGDRFASLFIKQLNAIPKPTATELREFYDLTNAQARLLNALLEDSSLPAAAKRLNLSIHTVRSHLQAIYKRLGVNNNSELLLMVASTMVSYKPSH